MTFQPNGQTTKSNGVYVVVAQSKGTQSTPGKPRVRELIESLPPGVRIPDRFIWSSIKQFLIRSRPPVSRIMEGLIDEDGWMDVVRTRGGILGPLIRRLDYELRFLRTVPAQSAGARPQGGLPNSGLFAECPLLAQSEAKEHVFDQGRRRGLRFVLPDPSSRSGWKMPEEVITDNSSQFIHQPRKGIGYHETQITGAPRKCAVGAGR